MPAVRARDLDALAAEIAECRACPRLVAWREQVGVQKKRAYRDQDYWARPVPGFGVPDARVFVVGLAPGAHGANRSGRVFTGDSSGDFLFASMYRCGFANQPTSIALEDGLQLRDAYIAAAVRCVPPDNKPTPAERHECAPFLRRELSLLHDVRVIVTLGEIGYNATWSALRESTELGADMPARRPKFGHLVEVPCGDVTVIASYHPSQQNTNTGKLTPAMIDAVFRRAGELA